MTMPYFLYLVITDLAPFTFPRLIFLAVWREVFSGSENKQSEQDSSVCGVEKVNIFSHQIYILMNKVYLQKRSSECIWCT